MPRKYSEKLQEVVDYCWSHQFLDVFHEYFDKYAEVFEGAPIKMAAGEHNLEYYDLFQKYLKLYESTLTEYLTRMDFDATEFYAEIASLQEDDHLDKSMALFINCLLASTDYESFYKVMAKQGNQRVLKSGLNAEFLKHKVKSANKVAESKVTDEDEHKSAAKSEEGKDYDRDCK